MYYIQIPKNQSLYFYTILDKCYTHTLHVKFPGMPKSIITNSCNSCILYDQKCNNNNICIFTPLLATYAFGLVTSINSFLINCYGCHIGTSDCMATGLSCTLSVDNPLGRDCTVWFRPRHCQTEILSGNVKPYSDSQVIRQQGNYCKL